MLSRARGSLATRGGSAALRRAARLQPQPLGVVAGRLRDTAARSFYDDATASGPNALYLESIYSQWKVDPSRLDSKWDAYFKAVEAGDASVTPPGGARDTSLHARVSTSALTGAPRGQYGFPELDQVAIRYLIRAYQVRGHEEANLDPLGQHYWRREPRIPELQPSYFGFTEADMDKKVAGGWGQTAGGYSGFLSDLSSMPDLTLRGLIDILRSTYCGTIGVEYMHIADRNRCNWIRERFENPSLFVQTRQQLLKEYRNLCYSDGFERFLGDKFKTTKRFGIDGGETVIPGLKALVNRGVELGCDEYVIGMPHRGRLNILVNILGKPMPQMLAEFMGTAYDVDKKLLQLESEDWSATGDVKYHLGTSQVQINNVGKTLTLTLEANPSHLETVGPVTLGRTRAKQYYLGNTKETQSRVMPILLHGDASFAGQGVVYEAMQLAGVEDFSTGGTVHVIVNNQVGFTTDPRDSRSTLYCSDLGKAFKVPIFHCNADDPIAVVRSFQMAAEWRQEWGSDVIIDVCCYRRYGHNETDNPLFTQPNLYTAIDKHPRSERLFAERLIREGHATAAEIEEIRKNIWDDFEKDYAAAKNYQPSGEEAWVATKWEGLLKPTQLGAEHTTGVDVDLLAAIGQRLCTLPEDFKVHSSIKRILKAKQEKIEAGDGIDWGTAEALAFGSLLLEGNHVRITGQDVQRGTFSHRHCVVHDQVDGNRAHTFLNHLDLGPQETFVARNSILSEYAVLGYELGYSYENPNALIIWEAQFGDFANTAQVIVDQFISAGEHKWLQQSALTVLLPHGYDGQGAEHSSCRLERYLQLTDGDEDDVPDYEGAGSGAQIQKTNMQVLNLSTPANYFHALRQQLHRDYRKPLVVAAPKNLLRHRACVSSLEDMGPSSKFQRVIGERNPAIASNPSKVNRLIFCSGKVYFELAEQREKLGLTNVAIVTVEMISPFPFDLVRDQMKLYPKVDHGDGVHPGDIIWCQEEPKNMGAWQYVRPRFVCIAREAMKVDLVMNYIGRRAAASPATGIGKLHQIEQDALISEALSGDVLKDGGSRASALLGHQT